MTVDHGSANHVADHSAGISARSFNLAGYAHSCNGPPAATRQSTSALVASHVDIFQHQVADYGIIAQRTEQALEFGIRPVDGHIANGMAIGIQAAGKGGADRLPAFVVMPCDRGSQVNVIAQAVMGGQVLTYGIELVGTGDDPGIAHRALAVEIL